MVEPEIRTRPSMNLEVDNSSLGISLVISNLHPRLFLCETRLEEFFQSVLSLYPNGPQGDLSIVFMEREAHNKLHGEFLNDYRQTDVITFPPDPEEGMAGEICVSVEQADEESRARAIPFAREMSLYLIHGWLHLVGFDDIEKVEQQQMRFEEERSLQYVNKLGVWPDFSLAPAAS